MNTCPNPRLAIVNGTERVPALGLQGTCPDCGRNVIAKCGQINAHHWSHEADPTADPWWEPKGPWHRAWQACVAPERTEVPMGRHIADIVGKNSCIIELQHSHIPLADVEAREAYYDPMIWVFDATDRFNLVRIGSRGFLDLGQTKHIQLCKKPVFLDFGDCVLEVEKFTRHVAKFDGFGRIRTRSSFADEYLELTGDAPPTLGRRPHVGRTSKTMAEDTHWVDPMSQGPVTVAKGSPYLLLNYYEVRKPPVYEWEHILKEHEQLANGWTIADVASMAEFLNCEIILLDGKLRVVPLAAAGLSANNTVARTRQLLNAADAHIAAGRMPMRTDAITQRMLELASEYEASHGGIRRSNDQQRSLFK